MNDVTKCSLLQFLALYLVSSLGLLFVASYYFYTSQISMQIQTTYYKMEHIADTQGLRIIDAHMHETPLALLEKKGCTISLYAVDGSFRYGTALQKVDFGKDFYTKEGVTTLVSQSSAMHLGIKYVVVQTTELAQKLSELKSEIILYTLLIALAIVVTAVLLSAMFLRPIRQRAEEMERFVRDTTHELNTPISALMMSLERLKTKREYDEKSVANITISVKNLKEIYDSLSFISFTQKDLEDVVNIDMQEIVHTQVAYFKELTHKKNLSVELQLERVVLKMADIKARLLVSNLLSNAIKYSYPGKKIRIELGKEALIVSDEGIGIEEEKLKMIFERFSRANGYAGGFGVGLSIVSEIAKEYGFGVEVDSQVGKGSSFKIVFGS